MVSSRWNTFPNRLAMSLGSIRNSDCERVDSSTSPEAVWASLAGDLAPPGSAFRA